MVEEKKEKWESSFTYMIFCKEKITLRNWNNSENKHEDLEDEEKVERGVPEVKSATQISWSKSGSAAVLPKTIAKVITNSAEIAAAIVVLLILLVF